MSSSSISNDSNSSTSVSSVPQLFQQLVLSSLPEDGSCIQKSDVTLICERAGFNNKELRKNYFDSLADAFIIGRALIRPFNQLLFRVTAEGPKLPPEGVVLSDTPPGYFWSVQTGSSAHGPSRGDEPAFRSTIIDILRDERQTNFSMEQTELNGALLRAKWYNKEERMQLLQKMIDQGVVERRDTKIALLQRSEQTPWINTRDELSAAILSLLPKDGSCIFTTEAAKELISRGWRNKTERARCIDFLVDSFIIGRATTPPTASYLFLVTESGPKLPPYTVVVSNIPPQYSSSWSDVPTAPDASSSQDMSPPRADEQNFASHVNSIVLQAAGRIRESDLIIQLINPKGWCNKVQRDRLLQKMIDEKLIEATVGERGSREIFKLNSSSSNSSSRSEIQEIQQQRPNQLEIRQTTATISSSNPSAAATHHAPASLKTATKLYFENIKDLVPSKGLEKTSLIALMAHQHGWEDKTQQDFLDELSSKGLVQLRSDPSNSGLIKLFCNSLPSSDLQQEVPRSPSISNGPQRRTRSPEDLHNLQHQQQRQEVVRILPMFSGRSPISIPPPQLVRNGQPLTRSNLGILMKMPPPFKVERS